MESDLYDHGLASRDTEMMELYRAALRYYEHIAIPNTRIHGIRVLKECADISKWRIIRAGTNIS